MVESNAFECKTIMDKFDPGHVKITLSSLSPPVDILEMLLNKCYFFYRRLFPVLFNTV